MSEDARRRSLGRGLSALFESERAPASESSVQRAFKIIPIELLAPSPLQPRHRFEEDELEALAASIRENGIVQPILVRPKAAGEGYEIVAGERRWRAAQRARLHEVPIVIRALDDRQALELSLVENIERKLGLLLGLAVKIEEQGEGGRLVLLYKSLEQLDELVRRLARPLSTEPVE
jgi:ParB family chromosome partitioning protein